MGPVAAGDIERLDRLLAAIAMTELGYRPRLVLRHRNELHRPFHRDPQLHQVVDQQPLMDVLRQDQHIGIGRQPGADITQRHPPRLAAAHPQIDRGHHLPGCHRRSGKAELAIEFEGAGMNHQCPRGHPRRRRLVDDAEPDAQVLSHRARTRPVGPAPTTRTSVWAMEGSTFRWSAALRTGPAPCQGGAPAVLLPTESALSAPPAIDRGGHN